MAKSKLKEWIVECKMTGTVSVYVEASSEKEAISKAESMDFNDSEIIGWEVDQPLRADLNE